MIASVTAWRTFEPPAPGTGAVDSYHGFLAAAADQDIRIPREMAEHSGPDGESATFSQYALLGVKKMIF
jgi:hypothetical protein